MFYPFILLSLSVIVIGHFQTYRPMQKKQFPIGQQRRKYFIFTLHPVQTLVLINVQYIWLQYLDRFILNLSNIEHAFLNPHLIKIIPTCFSKFLNPHLKAPTSKLANHHQGMNYDLYCSLELVMCICDFNRSPRGWGDLNYLETFPYLD